MPLPPPITITDSAANRVRSLLEKRGKPSAGVKVGVRSGGCSGLSYTIEYADEIGKFDEVVAYPDNDHEEFKVIIDPKAVMYLIGSQMDYVEEKMKSGFTFSNPNEKGRCGCGESFHV
ncbi:MAG: iscA [Rickettsiaceae bacterium]|jgi:iron-sulfur cluster assembly protein|nr:iscA [Rickettsiaceae bacterium]